MAKLKIPEKFIDEYGYDLAKVLWLQYGRNDKERWKEYRAELQREAEKRKRKTELKWPRPRPRSYTEFVQRRQLNRSSRPKPAIRSPTAKPPQQRTTNPPPQPMTQAPQRTTHDFPYLIYGDIPQDGGRKATIIRNPEMTGTNYGKRYQIALQFENGEQRKWSMNDITFTNLLNAFGRNMSEWLGKEVHLKTEQFNIKGEQKIGIIGEPVK